MPKKKSTYPFSGIVKKTSTLGIILAFIWSLIQLLEPAHSSQPVKLPSSDQAVELYSNQTNDDLTRLYENAIQSAHQSVALSIYALLDEHMIQALKEKSEEGIPVFIVCDAKASPGITSKLPKAEIVRRTGTGLMHQKILVIDQKLVLAGSANFTYSSLKIHGNLVLGIENPALAKVLYNRIHSMDEDATPLSTLHNEILAGPQKVEMWVLPNDPEAVNRMIALFQAAKKSIKVAMFTWTRPDFTHELIKAKKRGVKVEAVFDRYSGKGASSKIVTLLSEAGIPVSLSTGQGLLHHKFAYIDDSILVNGSANWTSAAFKTNDDYFIIVDPLTSEQKAKMDQLWQAVKKKSAPPNAVKTEEFPYNHTKKHRTKRAA